MGFDKKLIILFIVLPWMGFDIGIDYISHLNALRWVLIRELIIFLIVMIWMNFDKGIDYISHRNALR